MSFFDFHVAKWAIEKVEVDLESVPAIFKKLHHAIGVKDVRARQLNAGLFLELTGKADRTNLATSA